jgi:S1-C subfamily serine protease
MCNAGLEVREQPAGLAVEAVEDDGFAERAGLQPGDTLLALAGVPIYIRPELWVLMRQHTPGEKLAVEFARNGERLSASAIL